MQAPVADGQHPPSAQELIDKINALVVEHGHEIAGRKPGQPLLAHADSFVAECEVHHPTDVNLLRDATVTALRIVGQQSSARGLTMWRQWRHRTENVLSAFSKVWRIGRVGHDDLKEYLDIRESLTDRVSDSLLTILSASASFQALVDAGAFAKCAKTFVDQTRRRVFL